MHNTKNVFLISGCPGLSNLNNGAVLAIGNDVSDTATYTCSTGYVLTGIAIRTCQADSNWSGSEPTCTARGKKSFCPAHQFYYFERVRQT